MNSENQNSRKTISKFFYWSEQFIILLAHLFLLGWILYTLYAGGSLTFQQILWHFLGIGCYGGFLIWICAFLAKRRYKKEIFKK